MKKKKNKPYTFRLYDFPRTDEGISYNSSIDEKRLHSLRRRSWTAIIILVPLLIALIFVLAMLAAKF